MSLNGWLQIALFGALALVGVKPLGAYMARVFAGERTFLAPVLGPVERGFYRLAGVDAAREQRWTTYTLAMLVFSAGGFLLLYALQRLQNVLPRRRHRANATIWRRWKRSTARDRNSSVM